MSEEKCYAVHWEGPFHVDEAKKYKNNNPGYVLYQLMGLHHLYGSNVLLYIGQTNDLKTRLNDHKKWIDYEYDTMTVRFGSIHKFHSWDAWERSNKPFGRPEQDTIDKVEKLLIFANQTAYNIANKESARKAKNIRVFNTGRLGSIFPEISSWYFLDQ